MSWGTWSGGTGNCCSPDTFSGARLVASTVRSGQAPSSSTTAIVAGQQVFEVVHDQQHAPTLQRHYEGLTEWPSADLTDAEDLGHAG